MTLTGKLQRPGILTGSQLLLQWQISIVLAYDTHSLTIIWLINFNNITANLYSAALKRENLLVHVAFITAPLKQSGANLGR